MEIPFFKPFPLLSPETPLILVFQLISIPINLIMLNSMTKVCCLLCSICSTSSKECGSLYYQAQGEQLQQGDIQLLHVLVLDQQALGEEVLHTKPS